VHSLTLLLLLLSLLILLQLNHVQVLLAFKEYFPAMCCTDMLIRICDVMAVKPSELAFYPIPKLMIRRVGDHEQWSAWRAAEIGDGTREVTVIL
jgi:hypothetical protein